MRANKQAHTGGALVAWAFSLVVSGCAQEVVSLSIAPVNATVIEGDTVDFTATATNADGTGRQVNISAAWTSSDEGLCRLSLGSCLASGLGTVTISATFQGKTASTTLTIISPTASLKIKPSDQTTTPGRSLDFFVIATSHDGGTQDVTLYGSTWTSSDPAVAYHVAHGNYSIRTVGTATITATFQGQSDSTTLTVVAPGNTTSLAVSPLDSALSLGDSIQLTALASFDGGTTGDVSSAAHWTSSNSAVVTHGFHGEFKARGFGTSTITATFDGHSASTTLTVLNGSESLKVTPVNPTTTPGRGFDFFLTAIGADGGTRDVSYSGTTWTHSNPAVASRVSSGYFYVNAPGTDTITATFQGRSASSILTVVPTGSATSLALSPLDPMVNLGESLQLAALATFDGGTMGDVSQSATWTVSDPTVAELRGWFRGVLFPKKPGITTVTANFEGHLASTTVTIPGGTTASLTIWPVDQTTEQSRLMDFFARATSLDGGSGDVTFGSTWTHSNPAVCAQLVGSGGSCYAGSLGTETITASYEGKLASTTLTVVGPGSTTSLALSPLDPMVSIGQVFEMTALATFDGGTTGNVAYSASWTTSDPAVVQVYSRQKFQARSVGTSTLTATFQGQSASTVVTVGATASLTITPLDPTTATSRQMDFTATATGADGGTRDVTLDSATTWTYSDPTVCSQIGPRGGSCFAGSPGTETITATYDGRSASTLLTVVAPGSTTSMALSPQAPMLSVGQSVQLTALATFDGGTTGDVSASATWTSSNPGFVELTNAGEFRAVSPGFSTATATFQGQSASTLITVQGTTAALRVTPVDPTSTSGKMLDFDAFATAADGGIRNVTFSGTTWTHSNPAVCFSIGGVGSSCTTGSPGTATVTASYDGMMANSTVTVLVPGTTTSIALSPLDPSLILGQSVQLTALATLDGGTTADVSYTATWTSSDTAVARTTGGGRGAFLAQGAGTTTLTATFDGQSASTTLTVLNPATMGCVTDAGSPTLVAFAAGDGTSGVELWVTDGTAPGTRLVKDINPGSNGAYPSSLTVIGKTLFFNADDGAHGPQLWKSDGTSAGTVMVKEINPGNSSGGSPALLTAVGCTLFFRANDSFGAELWTSDGTAAGTVMVKDIRVGGNSDINYLSAAGDGVVFSAISDADSGVELWKSDGTPAGTYLLKDIDGRPGLGSYPDAITSIGGYAWFSAQYPGLGTELWRSNGTTMGTSIVKDINPGMTGSLPNGFRSANTLVYFAAINATGTELWKSDGTNMGTSQVADLSVGPTSSSPARMTPLGGWVIYRANTAATGVELCRTDGTSAGTEVLADLRPGTASSQPNGFTPFAGGLLFSADNGVVGNELWFTDGSDAGTVLYADLNPTGSSSPQTFTPLANALIFSANDGVNGAEVWRADPDGGVVMLKDINPAGGSSLYGFVAF